MSHSSSSNRSRKLERLYRPQLIIETLEERAVPAIVIDSFDTLQGTTQQGPGTLANVADGAGIIGGERDIVITNPASYGPLSTTRAIVNNGGNGRYQHAADEFGATSLVIWDGNDNNASTLNATGLGTIDLTEGGVNDTLRIVVDRDDVAVDLVVTFYSSATNFSTGTVRLPGGITTDTNFDFLFSQLKVAGGTGADMTKVGAITMLIDGPSAASVTDAPDLRFDSIGVLGTRARIADFIWLDDDGDGKQDAGEPGISGVTVKLYNGSTVVATTTTDSNGNYRFIDVVPGTYTVQVVTPTGYGITKQDQGSDDGVDSDFSPTTGKTGTITVSAGDNRNDIDGGLYKFVSIGDFVWDDKNANGIQDSGEVGINGATVKLFNGAGTQVSSTTTNSSGIYAFNNLAPDTYTVQFFTPTGYTFSKADQTGDTVDSDADTSTGKAPSITLTSGQSNTTIDAGMYKTATIGNFVWDDLNANGVQDSGEPGISGVTVNLLNSSGTVINTTTTNSSGNYTFTGLIPGTYAVQVVAPTGYLISSKDQGGNDTTDSDIGSDGKTANVTVISGETNNNLDGGLYKLASLSDFVWHDLNGDGKQDAGEPGLSGATVKLYDSGGTLITSTTTDSNGKYSFTNLTPGKYIVGFTTPSGFTITGKDQGSDDTIDSDIDTATGKTGTITLNSGVSNSTIDAGFYKVVSIGDFIWHDLNRDGKQDAGEPGLSGVTVRLLNSSGTVITSTTTDANGKYSFTNLAPGTYALEVVPPAKYGFTLQDLFTDDVDSDFSVLTNKTNNFAVVSGTNDDTRDGGLWEQAVLGDFIWHDLNANGIQDAGEPGIANVTVNLLDGSGTVLKSTTTDSNGAYKFPALVAGTYGIQVITPSGYLITGKNLGTASNDSNIGPDGKSGTVVLLSGDTDLTFDAGFYKTVSIGDYVWDDKNANGVQDAGELGISGVTVNLLDSAGTVITSTTTDSNGKYSFTNLTPGTYAVEVVAPSGYVITGLDKGGNDTTDSDISTTTGKTANFTLSSGTTNNDVDGGLYKLAKLGDFVWHDLNGNGVQDGSEPGLSGVTVELLNAGGTLITSTTTDSNGKYEFAGLVPNSYIVRVVTPSGYTITGQSKGGNTTLDSDISTTNNKTGTITLISGENNPNIDAGFFKAVSIGDYVWDDKNANGVQDGGELGISGVTVRLLDSTGATITSTTTDSNGKYSFTSLTPGTYAVQVVAPSGFVITGQGKGGNTTLDSDISTTTGKTANITLASGESTVDLDGGLYKTATIGDFIWRDTNSDGKQDAGEPGLSGVTVRLLDNTGTLITSTTTDSNGKYTFANLVPGTYIVEVVPLTGFLVSAKDQTTDAADSDFDPTTNKTSPITVISGETNNTIDGALYKLANIGDFVWDDKNANGVQDAGELGISGVTVNLLDSAGTVITSTTTDSNGKYNFTNLTPGTYAVQVITPSGFIITGQGKGGNATLDSDISTTTGKTANITLISGEENLNLDAGFYKLAKLGDFVWHDLNANGVQDAGEPGLSGVTVELLNAGGTLITSTTTDSNGKYEFAGLVPNSYIVRVVTPSGYTITGQSKGGNTTLDSDISITNNKTGTITLISGENNPNIDAGFYKLVSIGDFVWHDIDGNGKQGGSEPGLSGVTVRLLDGSGTLITSTTTNASGKYSFTNLVPGTFIVEVVPPTGYSIIAPDQGGDDTVDSDIAIATGKTAPFTLASGENPTTIDAGLYKAAKLGDFVWDDLNANGKQDAGEPGVSGVTVNLLDGTGTIITSTTTNGSGKYEFANLVPGTYAIQVVLPGGKVATFANQGSDDTLDSDIGSDGKSNTVTLVSGQTDLDLDAGIYTPVRIGDFVWHDLDGDGKQGVSEPGLSGVTVRLLNGAGTVIGSTTTDSNGKYEFASLVPGTYGVQVVAQTGFVFTDANLGGDTIDSDANPADGKIPNVTLISGGEDLTLDAGLFQLGKVQGIVWFDQDRDGILDSGEKGIPGVRISLLDSKGVVVGKATTKSDGSYLFDNLRPGNYTIVETQPEGYGSSTPDTLNVTITSGETENQNFGETLGTIAGEVYVDLDKNGTRDVGEPGIPGVTVELTWTDVAGNLIRRTTTTDVDGKYLFTAVPATTGSPYTITETQPAGFSDWLDKAGSAGGIAGNDVITGIVLGEAEDATGYLFGELAFATVGDFVWNDLNADGKQDAGEPGIDGVTVNLLNTSGTVVATTTTKNGGEYLFTEVVPGDYRVQFITPSGFIITSQDQGSDTTDSDIAADGKTALFTVNSGAINKTLDAGFFQYAKLGDFVWNDLNANGKQDAGEPGIGGVTVNLLSSTGSVIASTTTNGSGKYEFTNLVPGTYAIQVVAPTDYVITSQDQTADTADSDIAPSTGKSANVTLISGENNTTLDGGLYKFAKIGDFVWDDLNANGIQDAGEPGISGVTVNLLDSTGSVIGSTTTNGSGKYEFVNLIPGTYAIEVIAPTGYVITGQDQTGDAADSDIAANGKTSTITVISGDNVTTLDAGLYKLAKIGDFVWDDLNANGIQDAGEPGVAGVTVNLLNSSGTIIASTTTNGSGKYEFANLTPGSYGIQVVAPTGYVITGQDLGGDNTLDSDINAAGKSANITVISGENNTTLDAGMYKLAKLGDFVWDDLNANGVQDSGEVGISGVTVNLLDSTGTIIASTLTNGSGKYEFASLTPGSYSIQVVSPTGFVITTANIGSDSADSDIAANGKSAAVTLISGENNTTLDAGMYKLAKLGNFVWEDKNANGVQDAGEAGIDGVTVNLLDSTGAIIGSTVTSGGGKYAFDNLTPGSYAVQVVAPTGFNITGQGKGGDNTLDSDIAPSNGKTANVTLISGENNTTLDGGLYKFAKIGDFVWDDLNANGIQDAGEPGLSGVTVRLLDSTGSVIGSTTTNGSGKYEFANLVPGTYAIEVVTTTGLVITGQNVGNEATDSDIDSTGKSANITVISGENNTTLDAGLYTLAKLGNFVWDDLNANGIQDAGEPGIGGVTVNLLDASGTLIRTTTTAGDGKYEFANLVPGSYAIQVVASSEYIITGQDKGGDNTLDSDIAANGKTNNVILISGENNTTLDAGLFKLAKLGDFVWDDLNANGKQDAGEPGIGGVTVNLLDSTGKVIGSTTTTGSGAYFFDNLTPGTYSVQVIAPTGFVITGQNVGVDSIDSDLASNGKSDSVTLISGENNTSLDAGMYKLAKLGDFVWDDLNANGKQDAGEPGISGVTVNLLDSTGNIVDTTTTDGNGKYTFTNITPDTYSVQIVSPTGYVITGANLVSDSIDSDIASDGKSSTVTLISGENNTSVDGGLYKLASLGNFVWDDLNANGVQDAGEAGISGVTVNLLDSTGAIIATTTTDGSGKYSFTDLTPATYAVQVVAPSGYVISPANVGADTADSDIGTDGKTANVTLISGENNPTLDAGIYKLAKLGDFVWDDLNANGVQDAGEPGISGVTVNLLDSKGIVIDTTTTDGNGKYVFTDLTPGTYAVQIIAPTGYNITPSNKGGEAIDSDLASNGISSNVVLISGEDNSDVDGGMYQFATLGDFVWDDLNANGIQDAGEPGISGVTVNLLNSKGTIIATTTTDGNGKYEFGNLVPNTYAVQVVAPAGYVISAANETGDALDSDIGSNGKTANVTLISGENNSTLDAGMYKLAKLGDFVWDDLNANGIQDAGEPGISGVTVRLLDSTGAIIATTTTDASGKYNFTDLTPATYAIQVVAPTGFIISGANLASAAIDSDIGTDGKTANVTLISGENNPTLDGGLYKLASLGNFVWDDLNANGVQDAGEAGISGVTVNLLDSTGAIIATTTTDGSGKYSFTELTPATYAVQVVAPSGYVISPANVGADTADSDIGADGKTANVTLISGENNPTLDGGMYKLASIGNFIWRDLDGDGKQDAGEPGIAGVTVQLLNGRGSIIATTTTDPDGKYAFNELTPGTYSVRVIAPTGLNFTQANSGSDDTIDSDANSSGLIGGVTLISGENNTTLDAGLNQFGRIVGSVWVDNDLDGVRDVGERFLPGVSINLLDSTGKVIATTTTNANGTYVFNNVVPGEYKVSQAQPLGYGSSTPNSLVAVVASGETVRRDYGETLSKLSGFVYSDNNLNGRWDTATEKGIGGVVITLNGTDAAGNPVTRTTVTDATGAYRFENLLGGTYTVRETQPVNYYEGATTAGSRGGSVSLNKIANVVLPAGTSSVSNNFGELPPAGTFGYVYYDVNENGIRDPGEAGIAGVEITISGTAFAGTPFARPLVASDLPGGSLTIRTGADGKWSTGRIPPGIYTMTEKQPTNILDGREQVADTKGPNTVRITNDRFANIVLTPNPVRGEFNFGELKPAFVNFELDSICVNDAPWITYDATIDNTTKTTVTLHFLDASGKERLTLPNQPLSGKVLWPGAKLDAAGTPIDWPGWIQNSDGSWRQGDDGFVWARQGMKVYASFNPSSPIVSAAYPAPTEFCVVNPYTRLEGSVFVDANKNGVRDPGEKGIANVLVTATENCGCSDGGETYTVRTDANGNYVFPRLPEAEYIITEAQPTGFVDGKDRAGTLGGIVGNDRITTVRVPAGKIARNYDFGELPVEPRPSTIAGVVYQDTNRNNVRDANEPPIANVRITLTGTDDRGQSVRREVLTASNGSYVFSGLRPGTYTLVQSQPQGFLDGATEVGTAGGVDGINNVTRIVLAEGVTAPGYLFGEVQQRTLPPLTDNNPQPTPPVVPTVDPSKQFFLASQDALARLQPLPSAPGASADSAAYQPAFGTNMTETYISRTGMAPMPALVATATATPDGGLVRVFDYASNVERLRFTPYSSNYRGQINVATGDVNGDGVEDVVTAPGEGGASHIRVFNGIDGAVMAEYFAYAPSFVGGTSVSVADVDGDGRGEVITGTGVGGGPHVRIISGMTGVGVRDFFAFNPEFRGGVNVAAGDLDGDNRAEVITGTGVGGAPLVQVFEGSSGTLLRQFLSADVNFRGGVNVAVGDVDGNGTDDIITGAGAGTSPLVQAFSPDGRKIREFIAYEGGYTGGIKVATQDINGDGLADIITGNATGAASHVRIFGSDGRLLQNFFASPVTLMGGVFVG